MTEEEERMEGNKLKQEKTKQKSKRGEGDK